MQVLVSRRKKVHFNYKAQNDYICGIKLSGEEVKSIKLKQVDLTSASVVFKLEGAFVIGMRVYRYKYASSRTNDETRSRQLLLKKREIQKINNAVAQKELVVLATEVLQDRGLIKLRIELCKRLKNIDKRESIKKKDMERRESINAKYSCDD